MTASPISDLNPVFMAAGCKLTVMAKGTAHPPEHREQRKHSEPVNGNMLFHSFYMHSGWSLNVMVVITVAVNSNFIGN